MVWHPRVVKAVKREGPLWLNGVNINLEMVKSDYAWWYRQYARYDDDLKDAEEVAREGGLGSWAGH
jgi:endonuclease YncB( thermonuclease family)